jgi:hypothetical protein
VLGDGIVEAAKLAAKLAEGMWARLEVAGKIKTDSPPDKVWLKTRACNSEVPGYVLGQVVLSPRLS